MSLMILITPSLKIYDRYHIDISDQCIIEQLEGFSYKVKLIFLGECLIGVIQYRYYPVPGIPYEIIYCAEGYNFEDKKNEN